MPFIFFSTGTGWTYHTRYDDVGRLNLPKMTGAAKFAFRVIEGTVAAADRPAFRQPGVHPENIRQMRESLGRVLENLERLRIDDKKISEVRALHEELSGMKEPKAARLQRAMILLFGVARSQGER